MIPLARMPSLIASLMAFDRLAKADPIRVRGAPFPPAQSCLQKGRSRPEDGTRGPGVSGSCGYRRRRSRRFPQIVRQLIHHLHDQKSSAATPHPTLCARRASCDHLGSKRRGLHGPGMIGRACSAAPALPRANSSRSGHARRRARAVRCRSVGTLARLLTGAPVGGVRCPTRSTRRLAAPAPHAGAAPRSRGARTDACRSVPAFRRAGGAARQGQPARPRPPGPADQGHHV